MEQIKDLSTDLIQIDVLENGVFDIDIYFWFNNSPQVIELRETINKAVDEADEIKIIDNKSVEAAAHYINRFFKLGQNIDQARLRITRPIDDKKKEVMDCFNNLKSYSLAATRLENDLKAYNKELKRIEADRIKKEQAELEEHLLNEAIMMGDNDVAEVPAIEIKSQSLKQMNHSGVTTTISKLWRVTDFQKVLEYAKQNPDLGIVIVDDKKMNALRRSSKPDDTSPIPGIEYYTEDNLKRG